MMATVSARRPPCASRVIAAGLVLALTLAPGRARADFGTLFFSPAERAALDRAPEAALEPPAAPGPRQRIDGILRRPDGHDTVWLDGEPSPRPAGFRLAPAPALALIPDDGPDLRLRVGDSWPSEPTAATAAATPPEPPDALPAVSVRAAAERATGPTPAQPLQDVGDGGHEPVQRDGHEVRNAASEPRRGLTHPHGDRAP